MCCQPDSTAKGGRGNFPQTRTTKNRPEGLFPCAGCPRGVVIPPQAAFLSSKNCSSSVDPFNAPVEASASIVVVTASK